jgi:hypothetical protein
MKAKNLFHLYIYSFATMCGVLTLAIVVETLRGFNS